MLYDVKARESSRLAYLDLLRIIACFLVVFNHTEVCIKLYEYDASAMTAVSYVRLFIAMIVKINVPVFYMITGSLLLSKDRSYKDVFGRILKMFAILLGFSIVAHFCYKGEFYIPGFIRNFASATVDGAGPYWYLYAYLGILLILPFLRSIAVRMEKRDVLYLIGIRFIIGAVIPWLFLIANSVADSNMYIAHEFQPAMIIVDCIFYPLIGYGLDRCLEEKDLTRFNPVFFVLTFVVADVLGVISLLISKSGESFDGFVFIMVIAVFVLVKRAFLKNSHMTDGIISLFGTLTFGIYLLDPVIGPFFKKTFNFNWDYKLFWSSIIYCIFSMLLGGLLTYLFKNLRKRIIK